jgi:hypothetical protein
MITIAAHRNSVDIIEILESSEWRPRLSGRRHSGVADDLRAELYQLFLEGRQRPIFDRFGRRRRAKEIVRLYASV